MCPLLSTPWRSKLVGLNATFFSSASCIVPERLISRKIDVRLSRRELPRKIDNLIIAPPQSSRLATSPLHTQHTKQIVRDEWWNPRNSGGWSKFIGRQPELNRLAFLISISRKSEGNQIASNSVSSSRCPDYILNSCLSVFAFDRLRPNGIFFVFAQSQFSIIQ